MLKIFKTLYFFTFFIFLFYNYELSASSKTENNAHILFDLKKTLKRTKRGFKKSLAL